MNSKDKSTILQQYDSLLRVQKLGYDKSETLQEFRRLLDNLTLKAERIQVENTITAEDMKPTQQDMYSMIFETFSKYGVYPHYDLNEIDNIFENLQFKMTEEEKKCHKARVSYILG